jgi:hypothetical protein
LVWNARRRGDASDAARQRGFVSFCPHRCAWLHHTTTTAPPLSLPTPFRSTLVPDLRNMDGWMDGSQPKPLTHDCFAFHLQQQEQDAASRIMLLHHRVCVCCVSDRSCTHLFN